MQVAQEDVGFLCDDNCYHRQKKEGSLSALFTSQQTFYPPCLSSASVVLTSQSTSPQPAIDPHFF